MERCVRGLSVLALAVVAGCGGADSVGSAAVVAAAVQQGPRSCSFEHVDITARGLRLRVQGASGETWHDISFPAPRRIDLMQLGAGVFDALRLAPLPAGRYLEIRVLLDSDASGQFVQTADGTVAPLSVPGGTVSGVKLSGDIRVGPWQSADVAPDGFDACTSVVGAGKSGAYQLIPSIQVHAAPTPVNQESRMSGATLLSLPDGGFAGVQVDADGATLQRFAPDGAYAGAEIRFSMQSALVGLAPLRSGGYVATSYLNPVEGPGLPTQPLRFMMQLFDGTGTAQGPLQPLGLAYPISLSHVFPGTVPSTAPLAGGGYAILWGDLSSRYLLSSADGRGGVVPQVVDLQSPAQVIALANGGSLAVAGLQSVVAVPFTANGTQSASPQLVGATQWTPISSTWTGVAASSLVGGGAVIAWASEVSTLSGQSPVLQVRRVSNDGSPLGDAIVLGPVDLGPASVAGLDSGDFVVAWVSGGHVLARRFHADGTFAGGVVRLDAFTTSIGSVSVVATGAGGFLVSWSGSGSDGLVDRYGRLFDAAGLSTP